MRYTSLVGFLALVVGLAAGRSLAAERSPFDMVRFEQEEPEDLEWSRVTVQGGGEAEPELEIPAAA